MARRKHLCWARWHGRAWLAALCLAGAPLARANIDVDIRGVDDQLRTNVLAYLSADIIERLHNRVEREVESALKPFGYYEPKVDSEVKDEGHGDWQITIQ